MKSNKIYLIILLSISLLFFLGCQTKTNVGINNEIKTTETQQNNSTNMNIINPEQLLLSLNIVLPNNWNIDKSKKVEYYFVDEKGEERGSVDATSFIDNFDFITQKPNHSTIIKDEYIDIPLCRCRLITLDTDNGSAASGITGTHDVYYAVIPIKGKAIYILNFTKNDKNAETKSQFIEILNKLSLN